MANVYVNRAPVGRLAREDPVNRFAYDEHVPAAQAVSLLMPVTESSYLAEQPTVLHPVFDMSLPEGPLREAIVSMFAKALPIFDDLALLEVVGRSLIGRLSIPPIGEEPGHYAYLRTEEYSRLIQGVGKEEGVEYLPLRERICSYIESLPRPANPPLGFRSIRSAQLRAGRMQRYLGKSLDEVSAANRFHILVDGIHLNTHGAAIAAELAEGFLAASDHGAG